MVEATIRWTVPPMRDFASRVREMLVPMCRDVLDGDDLDTVAMVAHELLENLLKYSAPGVALFDLELSERSGELWVRVRTRNRAADATRAKVAAFARSLEASSSPALLYDRLIAESPYTEGSGLGLARIASEASMKLTVAIDDEEVALEATRRVTRRNAQ
jgi:hypothetical protein